MFIPSVNPSWSRIWRETHGHLLASWHPCWYYS